MNDHRRDRSQGLQYRFGPGHSPPGPTVLAVARTSMMWALPVVIALSLAACRSTPAQPAETLIKTVTAAPAPATPSAEPPAPSSAEPPAPAGRPHSALADITLPAGTVPACCGAFPPDLEDWLVTTSYDYTVHDLRWQLPVSKDYKGLKWCDQEMDGDHTSWSWGDANDMLQVDVRRTGTITITRMSGPGWECS
jgi:hypothetical protein